MRQLNRHVLSALNLSATGFRCTDLYKRSLRACSGGWVQADAIGDASIKSAYPESVQGDGDGWVISDSGAHYWGRYGAAGLLLRAPQSDGTPAVLLQHRAVWSHQGGTWGLPGGARDSHETPEQAAVREANEEAGLHVEQLTVRTSVVTSEVPGPGGPAWTYTTVIADAPELLDTTPNRESAELRWVAEDDVADLPLHPGFAASWDRLRSVTATIPLLNGKNLN